MTGDLLEFQTQLKSTTYDEKIKNCLSKLLRQPHSPNDFMGWIDLPAQSTHINNVAAWIKKTKKNQTTLCVLGIGGSCLGAKAIYEFLETKKTVLFFDNVDGSSFERRIANLDLKKCHFVAISKSGETSETLFQLAHILELFKKEKIKPQNHVSVVTEVKPSSLMTIAQDLKFFTLPVPLDVGGRFSVFSAVGLVPLMWAGISSKKLFAGAQWAKAQENILSDMAAFYLAGLQRQEWISIFWIYIDGLKTFGLWLEQLWAESLAKTQTRDGRPAPRTSTPISCLGATDQHSLLQQFTEGARDKHFMFIRSGESETSMKIKTLHHPKLALTEGRSVGDLLAIECAASKRILDNLQIATCRLSIVKNNEETMGALVFLFEMLVALLGECLEINAFNQPGVEAVKKVTLGTLGDPRYQDQALNTD